MYLKFWAKLTLFEQKRQLSIDIRSWRLNRSLTVTLSERVQLSLTGSPYALSNPMSLIKNKEGYSSLQASLPSPIRELTL